MLLPLLGACGTRSLSTALLVGMSFPKLQLLTLSPDCNTTAPPKPGESSVRAVEMLSWLLHNELFHGGFLGKRGLGRAVRPSVPPAVSPSGVPEVSLGSAEEMHSCVRGVKPTRPQPGVRGGMEGEEQLLFKLVLSPVSAQTSGTAEDPSVKCHTRPILCSPSLPFSLQALAPEHRESQLSSQAQL